MSIVEDTIERVRRSEYTGENRCTPCTVVNVLIATLGGGAVALYSPPLGALAFVGSLALIYLRGYLVPGTPTLTKRYFPDRVLRPFDKAPATETEFPAADPDESEPVDPEELLVEADVVCPCEAGDDLCLAPEFEAEWWSRIERLRGEEPNAERLAEMLEADGESVSIRSNDGAYVATVGDATVAQWESEAAFLADVAAEPLLRERLTEWADLDTRNRGRVLFGLRIFLEECPACDGQMSISEELVESCCRSFDVVAATCEACETRLLEVQDVGV